MSPQRIQLQRTKGWKKPDGAVVVARPSRWGNPFRVGESYLATFDTGPESGDVTDRAHAVELYRRWVATRPELLTGIRAKLVERDLACWCAPDQACHADVLLEIANGTSTRRTMTQAELIALARERFGDNPRDYAFVCPRCAVVATLNDFDAAGAPMEHAGQMCIGRHLGALTGGPTNDDSGRSKATRGCDWVASGLIRGPWTIEFPDGKKVPSFALADPGQVTR